MLLNAKYRLIDTKRIEISTYLHASFKKTDVSKRPIISRMIVHGMEQCLKFSESLKDRS